MRSLPFAVAAVIVIQSTAALGVTVTVGTEPSGLEILVDGAPYAAPAAFDWPAGSAHSVGTSTLHEPSPDVRHTGAGDSSYLEMVAGEGGTVRPESAYQRYPSTVTIRAFPELGYVLDGWVGTGPGTYTGPDLVATVQMGAASPLKQTATFRAAGPFSLVTGNVGAGSVTPDDGVWPASSSVQIRAREAVGSVFHRWVGRGPGSYTGPASAARVQLGGHVTQTAYFAENGEFPLTITRTEGGSVSPASGDLPAGSSVTLRATWPPWYGFLGWEGTGEGSYSGPDPAPEITIHGPITQHAVFERDPAVPGYELTISASDTDPFVHEGPAAGGVRELHLWASCNELGLGGVEAKASATGGIQVLAFSAAADVLDAGQAGNLLLAVGGCPQGFFRLGHFLVIDRGGEVCLVPSTASGTFGVVDCASVPVVYDDVDVIGFSSSGDPSCGTSPSPCDPASLGLSDPIARSGRLASCSPGAPRARSATTVFTSIGVSP